MPATKGQPREALLSDSAKSATAHLNLTHGLTWIGMGEKESFDTRSSTMPDRPPFVAGPTQARGPAFFVFQPVYLPYKMVV